MGDQLFKKHHIDGYKNLFPETVLEAIKDKESGVSLKEILQGFNMYFVSYAYNREYTRCQVPKAIRREGLWISYVLYDHTVITEWYNSSALDDTSWGNSSNWRLASNALVGDISIASNGNWVINGEDTGILARGDEGVTPLLRIGANNKLQVSYNKGKAWNDISDYIVPKLRWFIEEGTEIGTLQISWDLEKTWKDLSGPFENRLKISKYIGPNEELPIKAPLGTIIMKGPYYNEDDVRNDRPLYRMWIYAQKEDFVAWQDNGEFQSIPAGITQDLGDSENLVLSQKAVTQYITNTFNASTMRFASLEDGNVGLYGTTHTGVDMVLTVPAATAEYNGAMSAKDKKNLDSSVDLLIEIDKEVRPIIVFINGNSTVNTDGTSKRVSLGLYEQGTEKEVSLNIVARKGEEEISAENTIIRVNNELLSSNIYTDIATSSKTYKVNADCTYTIGDTDINVQTSAEAYITFINAMYFGFAHSDSMLNVNMYDLTKQSLKTNPSGTYTLVNPGIGFMWLCVPNSMTINRVTMSGFDVPIEQQFDGVPEGYKCYRSSNELVSGTYNIVIS